MNETKQQQQQIKLSSKQKTSKFKLTNRTIIFFAILLLVAFCHLTTSTNVLAALEVPRYARSLSFFGGGSLSPTVDQNSPPDFTEPIGNHTVPVGREARLACKINNLGNFKTAWLRVEDKGILTIHNNVITRNYRVGLKNDDANKTFELVIKDVRPTDRGAYMCQINSKPPRFAVGFLDVLTPPAFFDAQTDYNQQTPISDQPFIGAATTVPTSATASSTITVVEGANATLSCRATGHPAPTITWRREDGEPIVLARPGGGTVEQLTKYEGPTLALSSLNRVNAGAYLCIAANGVQPAASKRLLLEVQFSPILRLPQTELAIQLGHDAQLACHVDANPAATVAWQRVVVGGSNSRGANGDDPDEAEQNGRELVNSDKHEIVIKELRDGQRQASGIQLTLVIRKVSRHDFGLYRCAARNSLGVQSNTVRVYEHTSLLGSMFGGGGSQSTSNEQLAESNFSPGISRHRHQQPQVGGSPLSSSTSSSSSSSSSINDRQRAHTRSSWNQRGDNSPSKSGQTKAESAAAASASNKLVPTSMSISSLTSVSSLLLFFLRLRVDILQLQRM